MYCLSFLFDVLLSGVWERIGAGGCRTSPLAAKTSGRGQQPVACVEDGSSWVCGLPESVSWGGGGHVSKEQGGCPQTCHKAGSLVAPCASLLLSALHPAI